MKPTRFKYKIWTKDPSAHIPFVNMIGFNNINWRLGDIMLLGADYETGGPLVLHFERRPQRGFFLRWIIWNTGQRGMKCPYGRVKSWRKIIRQIREAPKPKAVI